MATHHNPVPGHRRRWRRLLTPPAILASGVLLLAVGALPGLGMFLCYAAVTALPLVALATLIDP